MTARTAFWRLATIIRQDRIRVKRLDRRPPKGEVRIYLRADTYAANAAIASVLQAIGLLQGESLKESIARVRFGCYGSPRSPRPFVRNPTPPQSPRTQ